MKKIFTLLFVISFSFIRAQELDTLISSEQISAKMQEVAAQINEDYKGKKLTIVMIMKGAVCVTADLIRELKIPFELDYVRASSYGMRGESRGSLVIERLDSLEIDGRDVLLIDDIFESGATLTGVMEQLEDKHPASIKTFILLDKICPKITTYKPDYVLFTIPNRFVIGYGLDYKEMYRGLPGIYAFPEKK
ncbi:MAG: hypoxanthine phosphoribosyltransferase [Simkaniaceae bacterium]|nr:hypoxanthine phosphoribosyltransferase [Simkaniaceae bacterium]